MRQKQAREHSKHHQRGRRKHAGHQKRAEARGVTLTRQLSWLGRHPGAPRLQVPSQSGHVWNQPVNAQVDRNTNQCFPFSLS